MALPLILPVIARGLVRFGPQIIKALPRIQKGLAQFGPAVLSVIDKVRKAGSVIAARASGVAGEALGKATSKAIGGVRQAGAYGGAKFMKAANYVNRKKWDITTDIAVGAAVEYAMDNSGEIKDEIQSVNDKLDGVGDQGSENATANTVVADAAVAASGCCEDISEALIPVIEAIDRLPAGIGEVLAELPKVQDMVPELAPTPAPEKSSQSKGVNTPNISISTSDEGGAKTKVEEVAETFDAFGEDAINTLQAMAEQGDISAGRIKGAFKQLAAQLLSQKLLPMLLGNSNPLMGAAQGGLGKLLGFASGGKPPVGVPSLVGERGPELFVPDISGRIVNANNSRGLLAGGSAGVTQNITFTSDVQNSVRAEILNASPLIAKQAAQSVMASMGGMRR